MTLFGGIVMSSSGLARETVPQIITLEEDEFLRRAPIHYSYETGQWLTSAPATYIPTKDQPADFTRPFLREASGPIPYPQWALERNWQGELIVAVEIRRDGTVGRWKIMRSSGYELLDRAAIRAIQKWRFEPARQKSKPVASCIQIPVHFRIDAR